MDRAIDRTRGAGVALAYRRYGLDRSDSGTQEQAGRKRRDQERRNPDTPITSLQCGSSPLVVRCRPGTQAQDKQAQATGPARQAGGSSPHDSARP